MNPIHTLTSFFAAASASDRISAEIRDIRRKYVGKMAVERMPLGAYVPCIIREITWESSYGLDGGFDVVVEYQGGALDGTRSHTSDKVLFFQGSK
jgi:hypothetical protein